MPLKGYRCPPGGEAPGRNNEIDYCLSQCKSPCVSPPLLGAMYKADTGNYHNDHTYISASMLAGNNCARQVRWERTEDFWDIPLKRYWPFRGTHAHSICEGAHDLIAPYGWLQEIRTETELQYDLPRPVFAASPDGHLTFTGDFDHNEALVIKIRGTADAYNPLTRTLADMKSMADTKANMVIEGSKPGTFSPNLEDSWVWQFNIYRWLLARTPVPQWVKDKYVELGLPKIKTKNFPAPTTLIMQGIGMMQIPRSGVRYAVTAKGKTTMYDIDPVPVLPLHEIEEFVRPRALYWYRALVLGTPVPVVGKDKSWMCRNCAFNGEIIDGERCFPTKERKLAEETNEGD